MQRVAPQDAPHAEPHAPRHAIALHCFVRVARARGFEAALREHQVRQRQLVEANQRQHRASRPAPDGHVIRVTLAVNSARNSENGAAYAARFARTTRSIGGSAAREWRLRISFKRRRNRLRATAVHWKRGTTMTNRGWLSGLARHARSRGRWRMWRPCSQQAVSAEPRARRTRRGNRSLVSGSGAWRAGGW